MLNSKQPPRVNAVRAGVNAGRHGGKQIKKKPKKIRSGQ